MRKMPHPCGDEALGRKKTLSPKHSYAEASPLLRCATSAGERATKGDADMTESIRELVEPVRRLPTDPYAGGVS